MCTDEHRPAVPPCLVATVEFPQCGSSPGDDDPLLQLRIGTCNDRHGNAVGYVELIGVLDAFTASHVGEQLVEFAEFAGDLVIDAEPVGFIDSAGLRLLEDVCDRAASHGNTVWLHNPSNAVTRLRQLVGLGEANATCAPGQTAIVSPRRWYRSRAGPPQLGTRWG